MLVKDNGKIDLFGELLKSIHKNRIQSAIKAHATCILKAKHRDAKGLIKNIDKEILSIEVEAYIINHKEYYQIMVEDIISMIKSQYKANLE